tara:strand:+ start:197 stop:418 length:222 start_codon:yes stop_codon:yes gene_type:complete
MNIALTSEERNQLVKKLRIRYPYDFIYMQRFIDVEYSERPKKYFKHERNQTMCLEMAEIFIENPTKGRKFLNE